MYPVAYWAICLRIHPFEITSFPANTFSFSWCILEINIISAVAICFLLRRKNSLPLHLLTRKVQVQILAIYLSFTIPFIIRSKFTLPLTLYRHLYAITAIVGPPRNPPIQQCQFYILNF